VTNDPGTWPLPRWIAHRGAGTLAPENTLAALRHGASLGWRSFEFDVKLSRDGVPFLLHDATLDRTTDGQGRAADQDWAGLSRLDAGGWHSRRYAGEPPATLQAAARWLIANGFTADIEIKPTPGQEAETGRVVAQAVAALWGGQARKPVLSSFRPESLLAAQEVAPHLPRALLLDSFWHGWQDIAPALELQAVITNHELIDADSLGSLRSGGWRVLCYTVNESARADQLWALGLDGLITDAVDQFVPTD